MTHHLHKLGLVAIIGLTAGLAQADVGDRKTTITTDETIQLPNMTLQPGTYVIKLAKAAQTQFNTVQFFDKNEQHLITTVIAIPNERLRRAGKTLFTFWEVPAGQPRAIRAWFYPGDTDGQEFTYPKGEADRLAAYNGNAKVPVNERVEVAVRNPIPAEQPTQNVPAPAVETAQVAPLEQPPSVTTLTAPSQSQAIQSDPLPRSTREVQVSQAAVGTPSEGTLPDTLPNTASPMQLAFVLGSGSFAAALLLRLTRHFTS